MLNVASRKLNLIMAGLWILAATLGMGALAHYSSIPGPAGEFIVHWPAATDLRPAAGHATLAVFLHPRCGCSQATMSDLERLVSETRGFLSVKVIFFKPGKEEDNWAHSRLWQRAEALPQTEIYIDKDGRLARAFGATTSGTAMLYDKEHKLVFAGGLTPSRGHEGPNDGHTAILNFALKSALPPAGKSAVFGCQLNDQVLTQRMSK